MKRRCGCEDGGDCTKTTVCAIEKACEDLAEENELLKQIIGETADYLELDGRWGQEQLTKKMVDERDRLGIKPNYELHGLTDAMILGPEEQ